MMKNILVLCTGNSCRSQMAEAFLRSFDPRLDIVSAGTKPAGYVHPRVIDVMKEAGLDLSAHRSKHVSEFTGDSFDFVITVCDDAREACPVFTGTVGKRLHFGFEDPAEATGSGEEILAVFRRVRDQIRVKMLEFVETEIHTQ